MRESATAQNTAQSPIRRLWCGEFRVVVYKLSPQRAAASSAKKSDVCVQRGCVSDGKSRQHANRCTSSIF
jgi:hypothetical protein